MKNGMRLISVVMNEENTDNRTKDTIAMMDYGFNAYNLKKTLKKEDYLIEVDVNLGKKKRVKAFPEIDLTTLNNNTKEEKKVKYEILLDKINAPIDENSKVGIIKVYEDNKYKYDIKLVVRENIKKANIFSIYLRNLLDIITNKV